MTKGFYQNPKKLFGGFSMKKIFGSILVLAMVLMATTGFACSGIGCTYASDYSNTASYQYNSNAYGMTKGLAVTERGGYANAGTKGFGPKTAMVGGSSLDTVYGKTGGFGNGSNVAASYGISHVEASGIEAAAAGRLFGNPSTSTYVNVNGYARQENGSWASAPEGTYASGSNESYASFSSNRSDYSGSYFPGVSASSTCNFGEATAIGGTFMTANYVPNKAAMSFGITGSASEASPNGYAAGSGSMSTQAQVHNGQGAGGYTQTAGSYCYSGPNSGLGFTTGGGIVTISTGANSTVVRSTSGQFSFAK